MPAFEESVWIARPPREVFAFATDFGNVSKWLGAVVRIEPLTEGPQRAGWKFKETRRMGGRECSAVIEITKHDAAGPPFRHAAASRMMGVEATYDYEFAAEKSGTRVTLRASTRATNLLGKLLAGMLLKAMKKTDNGQLERLKDAVEAR